MTPEDVRQLVRSEVRLLLEEFAKGERRRRSLSLMKDLINSYPDDAERILAECRNRKAGNDGREEVSAESPS